MGAAPAVAEDAAPAETPVVENVQAEAAAAQSETPVEPPAPAPDPEPAPPPPAETEVVDGQDSGSPEEPQAPPAEPDSDPAAGSPEAQQPSSGDTSESAQLSTQNEVFVPAPEPPYLHWRMVDANGVEQPRATVLVQGPSEAALDDEDAWAGTLAGSVQDNIGDPSYVGADLDPRPGFFTVKVLTDDTVPTSTHDIAADEHFRLRPVAVAESTEFRVADDAEWVSLGSVTDALAAPFDLVLAASEKADVAADELVPDQSAQLLDEPLTEYTLNALGPELTIDPPYVYWNAIDQNDNLVAGATFTIQGPRSGGGGGQWNNSSTVVDCTSAPCWGIDLDPEAGEFLVKVFDAHVIRSDRRYRVQQVEAPMGHVLTDTTWHTIAGTTNNSQDPAAGAWQDDTFGFDPFVMTALGTIGTYQSSPTDNSNPTGWNAGSPNSACNACAVNDFESHYVQNGATWNLVATWTRSTQTGNMGWSIEYTNAAERWGGTPQVPQPDRSSGGMVVFITNDNDASYTAQICRYTSQNNYQTGGTCTPISPVPLTRDGDTMTLDLPLPANIIGAAGCPSTLGSTGYLRSWTSGNKNLQSWTAPAAVNPPSSCGTTLLNITKMGDRNGVNLISGDSLTQAAPLEGATFHAYASTSGTNSVPTGPSLGSCVTNATGRCSIVVSNNNNSSGFWVVETIAPAGFSVMPDLGTGSINTDKTLPPYRFKVTIGSNLSSNYTRNITADRNQPNTAVSNAWVNVRNNPGFPEYCGLTIAMVFDTSGSIDSGEMDDLIEAGQFFVGNDALGGTPSNVTLFRFASTASTMNNGTPYDLSIAGSVADNTGYLGAAARINSELPNQGANYTNWDAALQLVNATAAYDMVIFLTDGDPTTYGSGSDTNTNVQFRMVEQAVMSANALKASAGVAPGSRTKIVPIGIGLSGGSDQNLKAISGPVLGDDYFLADNFEDLQTRLADLAVKNCGGTLTVVKRTVDASDVLIAEPAGGWTFTAETDGDYIRSGATLVDSLSLTTPTDPAPTGVNFAFDLEQTTSVPVNVLEGAKDGWTPISVDCGDTPVTGTAEDFTVTVTRNVAVSCTVTNREAPKEASITASKVWVITDAAGETIRTVHEPGAVGDDTLPTGISAVLNATGPGAAGATPLAWGATRGGYTLGNQVTITETVTIAANLPGCTVTDQKLTSVNGTATDVSLKDGASHQLTLAARTPATTPVNLNELEVTNTIKCVAKLSLLKNVEGDGSASPSDWSLTATGPGSPAAVTGADTVLAANTFEVSADSPYGLAEAQTAVGSPLAYVLKKVERCTALTGTTCATWSEVADVSAVQVPLGAHEVYRFVNAPAASVTLPLTGGLSAETFGIAGTGVALIAAVLAILYWRRVRSQTGVQ
ncbi:MAG: hypothetical protein GX862_11080 [Leucobacter sp.]|nr:hypothetical protein [Leucobacter sp.]